LAQVPDIVLNKIRKLIEEAEKNNIHIQRAVLFGSWATGSNKEYSDIDVALVSNDFEGIRFYNNIKLMDTVLKVGYEIETHPYRSEEFNEENPFVREILSYGIEVV
jgi:predicted nucleotidyltransferase